MKLSDTAVRKAKSETKPYKLGDGHGLFVLIHPNGGKYWRLAYRFADKHKLLALGIYPEVTLADARVRRDDARKKSAYSCRTQIFGHLSSNEQSPSCGWHIVRA